MKIKYLVLTVLISSLFVLGLNSCSKEKGCTDTTALNYNSDAEEDDGSCVFAAENELISKKITTAPTIDGVVDGMWADMPIMNTTVKVPSVPDDVFKGYVGAEHDVSMRSAYDNDNIYFLIQWQDAKESRSRQTWYFDTGDQRWKQESRVPTFDGSGNQIRPAFYEDKFAFLFNVDNSTPDFGEFTCFASCHTGLSEADGYARHYTNAPGETIDMWHWKYVRTNVLGQADDQYQDDATPNGRHSDNKVSGGYTNNVQELVITGTTDTVSVPLYFIPSQTDYSWITQDQIDAGTAQMITAVDADGKLTYAGGTIDPVADTDFQQAGDGVGPKGIPSIYTEVIVGSRGDISAQGKFSGGEWTLELSRALDTGDTDGQDVDLSSLFDTPFGIGVFDNAAIAHAIKTGLMLKFE